MKPKIDADLHVLDASALIALVHREPGWDAVQAVLGHSVVCAIHLTEAIGKLIRKGASREWWNGTCALFQCQIWRGPRNWRRKVSILRRSLGLTGYLSPTAHA